jgi:hypothetical protein
MQGTDISGAEVNGGALIYCESPGAYWLPPIMVSLKPQIPLGYSVIGRKSPTAGCQYNLAITVEQLM